MGYFHVRCLSSMRKKTQSARKLVLEAIRSRSTREPQREEGARGGPGLPSASRGPSRGCRRSQCAGSSPPANSHLLIPGTISEPIRDHDSLRGNGAPSLVSQVALAADPSCRCTPGARAAQRGSSSCFPLPPKPPGGWSRSQTSTDSLPALCGKLRESQAWISGALSACDGVQGWRGAKLEETLPGICCWGGRGVCELGRYTRLHFCLPCPSLQTRALRRAHTDWSVHSPTPTQ